MKTAVIVHKENSRCKINARGRKNIDTRKNTPSFLVVASQV